jgi:UDP-2,4-diacetamido-2,4,6-trideoxy-beta-L-altropyranose hydrolase
MGSQTLVFRADASVAMGTGHIMRCLALAQAWQDQGGRCLFATAQATPAIEERLCSEGVEVAILPARRGSTEDAAELTELARAKRADWVVVDGYDFGAEYQHVLKAAGLRQLFLDDFGQAGEYCADLVLDPNAHASESFYRKRQANTRLLLGTRYALLRREFTPWREWKREIAPVGRNVLVTMGGSDPENVTERVIRALGKIKTQDLDVTVVVGSTNPHIDAIERAASEFPGRLQLLHNVSSMPELMARADLAIIAAGGTLWELLYMTCPVVSFARNHVQSEIISRLGENGAVPNMGCVQRLDSVVLAATISELAASPAVRSRMSALGRETVDGKGADRLCSQLRDGCAGGRVDLL